MIIRVLIAAGVVVSSFVLDEHVGATHTMPGTRCPELVPGWSFIGTPELAAIVVVVSLMFVGVWWGRPRAGRTWARVVYWAVLVPGLLLLMTTTQAVRIRTSEAVRTQRWEEFRQSVHCGTFIAEPPHNER